ncbi:unnamed protein product [Linum tenue]|uniref:Pentatricopeptide repeat-containing protein n=1 Tax=Linum tenue TaxID=586396 RepID=A0AAV0JVG2_9ROSI|nr:unnamed protein product [Linum tenue]
MRYKKSFKHHCPWISFVLCVAVTDLWSERVSFAWEVRFVIVRKHSTQVARVAATLINSTPFQIRCSGRLLLTGVLCVATFRKQMNCKVDEATELFKFMVDARIPPNSATFTGL